MTPHTYDAWRLSAPEYPDPVGEYEGETCNRMPEHDEDQPRRYRLKPCNGAMVDDGIYVHCDTCGAVA